MKKILLKILLLFLSFNFLKHVNLKAMFSEFHEIGVTQNNFIRFFIKNGIMNINTRDELGNKSIAQYLGMNFFSPFLQNRQIFLFNNYMEFLGEKFKEEDFLETEMFYSGNNLIDIMYKKFPATGIYYIEITSILNITKNIIPEIIDDNLSKKKITARLWYLGPTPNLYSKSFKKFLFSEDAIYLSENENFKIVISTEEDSRFLNYEKNKKNYSNFLTLEFNLPESNYFLAVNSPRKIRLAVIN